MALTATDLLKELKDPIGGDEQKYPKTNDEIISIVQRKTIPVFSKYYPYYQMQHLEHSVNGIDGILGSYRIPILPGMEILGVSKIANDKEDVYGYNTFISSTGNIMEMQAIANVRSLFSTPLTFEFDDPNRITIFPRQNLKDLFVEVKYTHPKHFMTIPTVHRDIFIEMAKHDVYEVLHGILINYDEMTTPFGSLQLHIDIMEGMKEARKEYIDNDIRPNYFKSRKRKKIWIG